MATFLQTLHLPWKAATFSWSSPSNLTSSGRLTRGPPPINLQTADHGHLHQTDCNLRSEAEMWHRRLSDLAMDPPCSHDRHVQRIRKKWPVPFFPTNRWPVWCQHPVHEVNTTHSLIVGVDKVRLLDIVDRLSFHTPSHLMHWSVGHSCLQQWRPSCRSTCTWTRCHHSESRTFNACSFSFLWCTSNHGLFLLSGVLPLCQ